MLELDDFQQTILQRHRKLPARQAFLVGISGIDGSGKSYVATKIAKSLGKAGYNVALIGVDGWLNLPHVRFAGKNSAEHFYQRALRFDEMFERLVLPLRDHREVDLEMDFTEETATTHRRYRYRFSEVDIVLLEGIFLFKREHRQHFDLTCWIECSFETALVRAVRRCQEGLPPLETVRAFQSIYFPAQEIHFKRDAPRMGADVVLFNESDDNQGPRPTFSDCPSQTNYQ